jgi:prepilin-type N-terminal cleavage/methylation domain-containing protein/prepilin-type processing-associated H-X9-DG protein
MRRERRRGFTLVELLVVIAIIGVLMAVLVPALAKARAASYAIKCSSNLRSIGQGILMYVAENKGTFPAAYIYVGQKFTGGEQTPTKATDGYIHWSSYLFKRGPEVPASAYLKRDGWDMFVCPALENGGLPPTNTYESNRDPGQRNEFASVVDRMAPRMAYTVNEAIMPRNKFTMSWVDEGQKRTYSYVRLSSIKHANDVILATEFNSDWRIVSDVTGDDTDPVCKSHRPVHGFKGITGELDMQNVPFSAIGRSSGATLGKNILQVVPEDLTPKLSPEQAKASKSRLDWVGRNHGTGKDLKSNFCYVDGHVETKRIEDTLKPKFQWGSTFYSLNPHGDVQPTPD